MKESGWIFKREVSLEMDLISFLAIWLCKIIIIVNIIIVVNIIIIVIIILLIIIILIIIAIMIIIVIMIIMIMTRYVHGFGDPAAEFWLGLDKLKQLTR